MASRPARTVTSVLGIAVGVATVLSVLIVDHNTILTEIRLRPSYSGRPDVTIRPVESGAPSPGIPEALAGDRDLVRIAPTFTSRIRVHPPQTARAPAVDLELVAVEHAAGTPFTAWRVTEGNDFSAPGASEALLPERLAEQLGVAPGDTIRLQRAVPSKTACIRGRAVQVGAERIESPAEPFVVAGLIADDNVGRRGAVVIPYERGRALYAGAHIQPLFWAKLRDGAIYQDVAERLKASYVVEKPKGALVGERVDQRAFRKSIRITACLSLLLGLFVIYNAFSLSLVERVREIGLLRALGLTAREIAFSVVLEGAILSALGCAAGLALSLGIVELMKGLGITTLGFAKPLEIHEIPWGFVAIILLAGAAAALLGVVAPLLRVRRLSVIDALRAAQIAYKPDPTRFVRALVLTALPGALLVLYMMTSPPLGERQTDVLWLVAKIVMWVTLCFGLVLLVPRLVQWGVEGVLRLLLAWRPVERPIAAASTRGSHHRVFGSAMGIALVLAAVLAIHGITESLKDESARFADRTLTGRVFLRARNPDKAAFAEAAGAAGVADFYSLSAEVSAGYPIRGVDPATAARWVPQLRDDPALAAEFAAGRSVVMSEFLADSYDFKVDDRFSLSTDQGAYEVRLAAVSDAFGYFPDDRSFALMALPAVTALYCIDDAFGSNYVFHVADGADPDATRTAIAGFIPPNDVQWLKTAGEIKAEYRTDMNRDFWIFTMILAMTGVLAFVGLWNSLTVALLERRREIGLLRTLGFTSGQVGGLLAAESAALGVVGGAIALAAGVPIAGLLVDAIRVISRLDVRPVIGPADMAVLAVGAVLLALLATVPPALRLRTQVVASATRME